MTEGERPEGPRQEASRIMRYQVFWSYRSLGKRYSVPLWHVRVGRHSRRWLGDAGWLS